MELNVNEKYINGIKSIKNLVFERSGRKEFDQEKFINYISK